MLSPLKFPGRLSSHFKWGILGRVLTTVQLRASHPSERLGKKQAWPGLANFEWYFLAKLKQGVSRKGFHESWRFIPGRKSNFKWDNLPSMNDLVSGSYTWKCNPNLSWLSPRGIHWWACLVAPPNVQHHHYYTVVPSHVHHHHHHHFCTGAAT